MYHHAYVPLKWILQILIVLCSIHSTQYWNDPREIVMSNSDFPVVFVTHGAGPMMFFDSPPLPILGAVDRNSPAAHWFRQFSKQLALPSSPKAIVIISAHWETANDVHISTREQNEDLLYDYSGFPAASYQIEYRPPGDVKLSERIKSLLEQAGIAAKLDEKRKFDHGVFVPLKIAYPEANIAVVAMSVLRNLSPSQHLAIGKALAPLRKEGILIIGSGSAVHGFGITEKQANAFMKELSKALTEYDENEREQVLLNWEKVLPYARLNHPREEHFIPLHVVVGAAGADRGELLNPNVVSSQASFKFGSA